MVSFSLMVDDCMVDRYGVRYGRSTVDDGSIRRMAAVSLTWWMIAVVLLFPLVVPS